MSNPPYGVPGNQGTPWPQYGDNGAGAPMQGMPVQGMPMQGGPQNFQGGGYGGPVAMPVVKGPSKAPGVILIIVGVLMAIVVAPILFFVLMFQGLSDVGENLAAGTVVSNGGTIEVGANGSYMVSLSPDEASSCTLTDGSNQTFEMKQLQRSSEMYYIDGLAQGTYRIQCQGLPSSAKITGLPVSGEDMVESTGGAFLWSSLVGVTGVVLLIVGIVLVVRAGSKRKELQRQAMMSAMY